MDGFCSFKVKLTDGANRCKLLKNGENELHYLHTLFLKHPEDGDLLHFWTLNGADEPLSWGMQHRPGHYMRQCFTTMRLKHKNILLTL